MNLRPDRHVSIVRCCRDSSARCEIKSPIRSDAKGLHDYHCKISCNGFSLGPVCLLRGGCETVGKIERNVALHMGDVQSGR